MYVCDNFCVHEIHIYVRLKRLGVTVVFVSIIFLGAGKDERGVKFRVCSCT